MDNKVAVAIIVAAAVIIAGGGIVAIALGANFDLVNDDDYVVYYGNGEKTTNGETSLRSTSTEVLPGSMFDDTKKYFLIWNTKADGTGDNYRTGQEVKIGTKLYAQWGDHCLDATSLGLVSIMKGLSLTLFDEKTGTRGITFPAALSNDGVVVIVITGWKTVTVDKANDTFTGSTTGSVFDLKISLDGQKSYNLDAKEGAAYITISYDADVKVTAGF